MPAPLTPPGLGSGPERAGIEAQVAKILASPQFRASRRRCDLLQWAVGRYLAGETEPAKEYHIAREVFGKPEDWDPRFDSSVRVEFNRMRQKLREYYESEGAEDPIVIEFPFRGYLPIFKQKDLAAAEAPEPLPPAASGRNRRWPVIAAIAALLVVAAVAVLGFRAYRSSHSPPPINTIAVLPFMDLTPGGQHEYLSDGFTEELTNSLAMIKGLGVIARTSAFQFKGKNVDVREIGRQLGAGAVVEGSIQSQGDRIRVVVQLNRTADGTHIWVAQYDRDAKDILGIEDEIAQTVAGALRAKLTGPSAAEFDPGPKALDEYMQGWDAERKGDTASLRLAEQHYRNALRAAPGYARAHARLGSIYIGLASQTGPEQQARLEDARKELETAVSLDSRFPMAIAGLALVDYVLNWDWPSAEAGFKRALALSPSGAAHQTYAWALMTRGRFAESEQQYREAIQVDPLNCVLRYNLAQLFSRERRNAEAREELEPCLSREPDWFLGRFSLGYFELFDNRPNEAEQDLERAAKLAPGSPMIEPGLVIAYAESGRRVQAVQLMRQLESQAAAKGYVRYNLGQAYTYLGNQDRLYYWLERSVDSHEQQAMNLRIDPVLAPYQQDPRMIALERRVRLLP